MDDDQTRFSHFSRPAVSVSDLLAQSRKPTNRDQDAKQSKGTKKGLRVRLKVVYHFFRQVTKIRGVRKKLLKHQFVCMLIAAHENLLTPYMYTWIIGEGITNQRLDICVAIAFAMFGIHLLIYYLKLNYFHGSFLIVQHLRSMLTRAYLSLTEEDRMRHPMSAAALQEAYRVAFVFTVEEIRNQCYKSVFHHGLPNLYALIFSFCFLIATIDEEAASYLKALPIVLCVFLVVLVVVWYFYRALVAIPIWKMEHMLSRKYELQLDTVLTNWRTIRYVQAAQGEASKLINLYWEYIRKGQYV